MSQKKRKSYTIQFKLEAVEFAENNSILQAAEHFNVHVTQINRWKKQKETMMATPNRTKHIVKRKRALKWPELDVYLKNWVINKRQQGFSVSASAILKEAKSYALRENLTGFKGSTRWVFKFMKRNKLTRRAVTSVGQNLPDDWEEKMRSFVNFVSEHKAEFSLDHIGNMDEVPVTFDMPSKFTIDQQGSQDIRVTTSGAEKTRFTVVLCVTASGIKLPAYVIFKRKTIPKGTFPSNILVSANEKSSMTSSETILWHNKIWLKRRNILFHQKSMLMLDSAPGHKTDEVKKKFKDHGTLMAMIPGGLTKKLQVLDISVNKSFKSRLRSKWENWMINGLKEYTKSGSLKRASYEEICTWISQSWEEVPVSAIKNGFIKTTINFYGDENNNELSESEYEDVEYLEDSQNEDNSQNEDDIYRNQLIDVFMDEENFASEDEEEI